MKKYFIEYMVYISNILEKEDINADYDKIIKNHLLQIKFMQHERLIHLIVTFMVAIVMIICLMGVIGFEKLIFMPLVVLLLALLIPYLYHYYFLENNVQKLYNIYNQLIKLSEKENEE